MTNEEAIKVLEAWIECDKKMEYADRLENIEIYNMAIKALEQQPCEDAISRQAAIDAIYKQYIGGKDAIKNAPINDLYAEGLSEAVDAVWDLPSVTLQAEQKAVLDKIRAEIENHCGLIKEDHCKYCGYCNSVMGVREILEIINKYKAESEDKR